MALKITLLGAGSVVFAKTLLSDVLQFPELSDATISLMDIDPARLKVAKVMAERIVAKLGVKARVEATLDRREAIRDANYVIVTVQVGGYEPGTTIDFEIPRRYGLRQTIGDTLGIGGIFRALRTIPVINAFARDIAEVGAPGCLLLNYTNPMAMNCWAVDRAVGIPHVGLCHSVQGTSQQLANFARLPYEDVSYLVAGINHMAFFLRFEYKRQDAYPLLFALFDDAEFTSEKVRFEMMRRTGYFVTESSEHQSEYVPYFIHHGQEVIDAFDIPLDEYLRRCRSIIETWKDTEANLLGENGEITVGPPSHEYGSYIIHARETNVARVIYGNVPNRGLITNLPAGCCVEVPCLVDAAGLQPTVIGALPPQLAALCQTNINVQALTVEAALTARREHIYHAAMLDPHTSATLTLDRIWSLCDDLIEAHQKVGLLGEFQPTIRDTGRAFAGTGDRVLASIEPAPDAPLDEQAEELHLSVRVVNPGPRAVTVPLSVRSLSDHAAVAGPEDFSVALASGETIRRPLTVRRNGSNGNGNGNGHGPSGPARLEELHIALSSTSRGILTQDFRLPPRRVLEMSADQPAEFALTLAGFPAANGTISLRGGEFVLAFDIHDSKVRPGLMERPWTGSCVELFFSFGQGKSLRHIFLVPMFDGDDRPEGKVRIVNRALAPVANAHGTCVRRSAGYAMEVSLPLPETGLPPGSSTFLFDALATIGALGEAHSGGRATFNGSTESGARTDHYARVQMAVPV